MLRKYPDRTIATILMRCGGSLIKSTGDSSISEIDPRLLRVPVLISVGEKEPYADECRDIPKKIFFNYRKAGAFWALAVEADTGHESGNTRLLAIPYLDAVLTARLPMLGTKIRPMDEAQAWLGNTSTHATVPVNQYQGNSLEAAWFPNKEVAYKWQQYVTTNVWNQLKYGLCKAERLFILKVLQHSTENCYPGKVLPTQKPDAPTNVRVTKTGKAEVILTWDFSPDLENGLPSFRIYHGDSLIGVLQGQEHNFGDAPQHPYIVLEFRDKNVKHNAIYTVSAFNALGESVSQPSRLVEGVQNRLGIAITPTTVNLQQQLVH
jgi:hypothetical protein